MNEPPQNFPKLGKKVVDQKKKVDVPEHRPSMSSNKHIVVGRDGRMINTTPPVGPRVAPTPVVEDEPTDGYLMGNLHDD